MIAAFVDKNLRIVHCCAGFIKIGGYSGLTEKYMNAIPKSTWQDLNSSNLSACGLPRDDSFHIFRHPTDSDLPWPGMLSGIFLLGSWYWCTDQVQATAYNVVTYFMRFAMC